TRYSDCNQRCPEGVDSMDQNNNDYFASSHIVPVLVEKAKIAERDIAEIKQEQKEFEAEVKKEFDKVKSDIDILKTSNQELRILFENSVKRQIEKKVRVTNIAEMIDKDRGWNGVAWEVLKLVALLIVS